MFLLLTHMACPTLFKCFVNENFDDDDDDGNSKVTEIVNMLQQPVPRKYTTVQRTQEILEQFQKLLCPVQWNVNSNFEVIHNLGSDSKIRVLIKKSCGEDVQKLWKCSPEKLPTHAARAVPLDEGVWILVTL